MLDGVTRNDTFPEGSNLVASLAPRRVKLRSSVRTLAPRESRAEHPERSGVANMMSVLFCECDEQNFRGSRGGNSPSKRRLNVLECVHSASAC